MKTDAGHDTPGEGMTLLEPDPIDAADVVVVLTGTSDAAALRSALDVVRQGIAPTQHVLVLCPEGVGTGVTEGEAGGSLTLLHRPLLPLDRVPAVTGNDADPYRSLFTVAHRVGARAAVVLGSDPAALSPDVVQALVGPVLDRQIDVVAPLYALQKFDGLINRAIVYPLTRALYGKRIRGQIGLDFAFSARVASRWRGTEGDRQQGGRPTWIIPQAVAEHLTIGQSHLRLRLPPSTAPGDVSAVLGQVLGSLFHEIERHAPFWQRVRWSEPVPTFGEVRTPAEAEGPADVQSLIESFQLAYRNLQDVWGLILPPATLVELKRLTLQPAGRFQLSDDLWARIVYDFVLGHRLRAISREHLLGALTPAYLAWVASYALGTGHESRAAADDRLERLCLAYEAQKPYLLRRWRWPDRFNP